MAAPTESEPIRNAIRAFVAQQFRDGQQQGLEPDTPLVSSGLIDSAGVVELVAFLEQRFEVRIDDAQVNLRNFDTLAGLAALVAACRQAASRPGNGSRNPGPAR